MNEPRDQGHKKKHLKNDHHFKTADESLDDIFGTPQHKQEDTAENPIVLPVETDKVQQEVTSTASVATDIESPIEKKIRKLVEAENGWNVLDTDIVSKLPPRNGMPVCVSATPNGKGVKAMWKRTRAFANPTKSWQETGKWIDHFSGMDIPFEAKYWREAV